MKRALVASATPSAQSAARKLRERYEWVEVADAELIVVLGGDGYLLQTLHDQLATDHAVPVFGMNRGTVGFLLNSWRADGLDERLAAAKRFRVTPLCMTAQTVAGDTVNLPAINEVSLLRQTRQTASLEITVNDAVVMPGLACDGILVATPAGSTAYNLSAHGPILPLGSAMLALTPISPFRPRRWRGAILPDKTRIGIRILNPKKRPVSAVADQREVRDVARVDVAIDHGRDLTLLFDPEHALDDRITMEQFVP